MPRQTERNTSNFLGSLLQTRFLQSFVRYETNRATAEQPGLRTAILITPSDRASLAVEAEYQPATTVECEASEQLGLEVDATALRCPDVIGKGHGLLSAFPSARLNRTLSAATTIPTLTLS